MLDLIIKNGQCYIDGELKNSDVSNGIASIELVSDNGADLGDGR